MEGLPATTVRSTGSFEDPVTFSDGWTATVEVGPPGIVWTLSPTTVSGNEESEPADGPLSWLLNTWQEWRFKRLRRKYEEIRAPCVRAHGPEGCNESTVKDLAPVFEETGRFREVLDESLQTGAG